MVKRKAFGCSVYYKVEWLPDSVTALSNLLRFQLISYFFLNISFSVAICVHQAFMSPPFMAMCDKAWEKGEEIGRAHEDIDNKWNFLRSQWIRPQGVGQSVSQWRHSRSPSHFLGNPQLIIHFLTTRYHQSCECTNLDWISFKTHDGVAPHTRRVWVAHKSWSCERVLSKLCGLATKQWLTVTQPTKYDEILPP